MGTIFSAPTTPVAVLYSRCLTSPENEMRRVFFGRFAGAKLDFMGSDKRVDRVGIGTVRNTPRGRNVTVATRSRGNNARITAISMNRMITNSTIWHTVYTVRYFPCDRSSLGWGELAMDL